MFNPDLPIGSMKNDKLNRLSFAKDLAKIMFEYNVPEGIVIGMYGKWGSGKTSLLNMALESLSLEYSSNNLVILRFNPWLCSDSKQLIYQFLKQLSSAIKIKQPSMNKICKFINNYADAFELARLVPVLGNCLVIAGKILNRKAKLFLEEKNNNLQGIKDSIMNSLKESSLKIIVTIDDIDRLSNEEIIAVFQLIKSIADFPHTIYLVSFDRDIVIKALEKVQQGDGGEYLEKIIQVPFEIPTPEADSIYQVFFDKIKSIITVPYEEWDNFHWNKMWFHGINPYMQSIRHIIRLVNTFELKYILLKDEIYFIDLLGLTCLQIFEPEIYSKLPFQKEYLCGDIKHTNFEPKNIEMEKIKKAYNFIIAGISEDRITDINNILLQLFPKLRCISQINYETFRMYNNNIALRNGFISCVDCFDRYFSFTLEPAAIPKQIINNLLFYADEPDLIDGIRMINSSKKINTLLDHINANFESKNALDNYEDRVTSILKCLFLNWHNVNNEDYYSYGSIDQYLIAIVENILKNIDTLKINEFLDSCFNDPNMDLSVIHIILQYLTEKENEQQDKLITPEKLSELERIFIERTIHEFESNTLLDRDSALDLILLFEKIDIEKSKKYTSNMIDSDISMAKFINVSIGHGKMASNTVMRTWFIRKEDISRYVNIYEAYDRILKFISTDEFCDFSLEQKENIIAFIIYMELNNESDYRGYIDLSDIEKKLKNICYGE